MTIEDKAQPANLVKSVFSGNEKVIAKTIYDFRNKTKEQITEILLNEEWEFLKANPDYQYDNYRYEDGKHGERTIILIFKRK